MNIEIFDKVNTYIKYMRQMYDIYTLVITTSV